MRTHLIGKMQSNLLGNVDLSSGATETGDQATEDADNNAEEDEKNENKGKGVQAIGNVVDANAFNIERLDSVHGQFGSVPF